MKKLALTFGKHAIVDDEDYERFFSPKWHYQPKRNTGYAIRSVKKNGKNQTQRLHRLILNAAPGQLVDHINGDGLDNRKCNLRVVGHKENCINRRSKQASGYKGVRKISHLSYMARIGSRNNHKIIGYFRTAKEAAKAYDREAKAIYGEFAVLNFKENL